MKNTIKTLLVAGCLVSTSQAAVTISGTLGSAFKTNDLATNIASGSLAFLVVDTDGNGFLNLASGGAVSGSTAALSGKTLDLANVSTTVGSLFGGDTILSIATVGASGSISSLLSSIAIAGFESKNFALVYFGKTSATLGTEGLTNQYFGMFRGADWTLPSSDSGTFSLSPTDATPATNYYSVSATISAAQVGASGFFTGSGTAGDATADIKGTTFQITNAAIPEPSAALLGAVGALGLLRRRRA